MRLARGDMRDHPVSFKTITGLRNDPRAPSGSGSV